jgi:hypothetical protein
LSRRGFGHRGLAVASCAAAILLIPAACAGDEESADTTVDPPEDVTEVCDSLQTMVDELAAGRSVLAVQALDRVEATAAATSDDQLRSGGESFFAAVNDTVPDPGSLTPEETGAVGDRVLGGAAPALSTMIDRCGELGLPIDNLPTEK